jgi:EVE domain-containing protein
MQVNHGKAAPLKRIHPGDRVAYYSPTEVFRGKDGLQSFTAIGIVKDAAPYQVEMSGCFCPFRRDVDWRKARETPIKPLLDKLQFTTARRNWGFQLRFGLFEISEHDMIMIAAAMGVSLSQAGKNLPLIPLSQNRAVRHHP